MLATPGFMLLDQSLNLVGFNSEAIQILCYPTKPDQIKQQSVFIKDKLNSSLIVHDTRSSSRTLSENGANQLCFVSEYVSGRRRYICRAFRINSSERSNGHSQALMALLLERHSLTTQSLDSLAQQFDLTQRELQTVSLLMEGLTSKEIANRMKISPNTVKAFLRLVMVKMNVSTRSGIVGKIVECKS